MLPWNQLISTFWRKPGFVCHQDRHWSRSTGFSANSLCFCGSRLLPKTTARQRASATKQGRPLLGLCDEGSSKVVHGCLLLWCACVVGLHEYSSRVTAVVQFFRYLHVTREKAPSFIFVLAKKKIADKRSKTRRMFGFALSRKTLYL